MNQQQEKQILAMPMDEKEMKTAPGFLKLPEILVDKIFDLLETREILKLRRVSNAFRNYIDDMKYKRNDIFPFWVEFKNDTFHIYWTKDDWILKRRNGPYNLYGPMQLNWMLPNTITFENSTLFETPLKLECFFENVESVGVKALPMNHVDNLCENLKFMKKFQTFSIEDETFENDVVVKIILTLPDNNVDVWTLSLCGKSYFYDKSIIDAFFKVSSNVRRNADLCIIQPQKGYTTQKMLDRWINGIRYFIKKQNSWKTKSINFHFDKVKHFEIMIDKIQEKVAGKLENLDLGWGYFEYFSDNCVITAYCFSSIKTRNFEQ